MAITRTQIAKQLLANGGRIGLRSGGPQDRGDEAKGTGAYGGPPGGGATQRDSGRDFVTSSGLTRSRIQTDRQKDFEKNFEKNPDAYKSSSFNFLDKFNPIVNTVGLGIAKVLDIPTTLGTVVARGIFGPKKTRTVTLMDDNDEDDNVGGNPEGPEIILSPMVAQAPSIMAQEPEQDTEDLESLEGLRLRYAAEGGRAGLAGGGMPYEGGIMDLETGRQQYFLGKLVKKVGRTVKKIAKSPLGRTALLGGLGYLGATQFGGLSGLRGTLLGQAGSKVGEAFVPFKEGILPALGLTKGGGSLMPTVTGGITLASTIAGALTPEQEAEAQQISDETGIPIETIRANPDEYLARRFKAEGGSMNEPVAKKTMPLLDMDGKEMDLRAEGGFVPIGRMEKADDVPARLSKNEFVFTADAVRNAGEGDVDKGAEVMYNMMKNLESGGEVSEESQGLEGARKMFQTSQRLEEVL
jgi:hypothetical protein